MIFFTVISYFTTKGETIKFPRLILFACIALGIIVQLNVFAQTRVCDQLLFNKADHIRNGSLEQYSGYCYNSFSRIAGDRVNPVMSTVIRYWDLPVQNYFESLYFGKCNNFYHPIQDAAFYVANPTVGILYLPLVPLPIPDGQGVLGFQYYRTINGSPATDSFYYKDYISNNLFRTLKKDSTYRLDFNIGFGLTDTAQIPAYFPPNNPVVHRTSSAPVKMELFGITDSTHLPFNKPTGFHPGYGCLSQISPEWISLGSVTVFGTPGNWVQSTITFTAPVNMQTLAIGPACDFSDVPFTPLGGGGGVFYYFLDNLRFYQASSPKPILAISAGSFCDGPNASLTLHMKSDAFYKGSQLQWYKNNTAIPETGGSVTITKNQYGEGWYQCGVQNDSVCIRSDSFQVFWDPFINATIGNHPDTTACNGDTVLLAVAGGNHANYLWSDGSYSSSIRVTQSGSYSVTASNACNTVTAVKNVLFADCPPQLFVPSAFTPNHDGLNDVFRAFYKGKVNTFSLSVYNRYGQRIFFSNEISKGWDGSFQRKQQDSGTYVWVVQYTDGNNIPHTEKGTVLLLR